MGNEKANGYWEAELPPNYDRVGIENFIRAKYDSFELFESIVICSPDYLNNVNIMSEI
jgi:hypothetical protein